MFYKIKSYGKFLLKSTNQHGVHSPFVYNLVTKCFYDKTQYRAYKNISNYKKNILNKSVSCTLNGSATYKATDKLLFRLTQYFKPKNILELYTASGINTYTMSLGNPNTHITTIESCLNTSRFTKHLFTLNTQKNINIISVDCNSGIKNLNKNTYDFIVFNKKKDEDTTLNTFKTLFRKEQAKEDFIIRV